jgi:hypothetical protein
VNTINNNTESTMSKAIEQANATANKLGYKVAVYAMGNNS